MGEFMGFTGKGIRFFFCMFPMWKKYISAWKVHTLWCSELFKNALECCKYPVSGDISESGNNKVGIYSAEFKYLNNDLIRQDEH